MPVLRALSVNERLTPSVQCVHPRLLRFGQRDYCGSDAAIVRNGRAFSAVHKFERPRVKNLQARHLGQDVVPSLLNVLQWQLLQQLSCG